MTNPANGTLADNWRRLILFGRYPAPGMVKSRLIPLLGPVGAAHLQKRLTLNSLDTLLAAQAAPVEFCFTGGTRRQVRRWLVSHPLTLTPQSNGSLGRRMQTAIERALGNGCRQVVLVGTDIPGMRSEHIRAAFEALGDNDLVLGPSQDGGYWLVGLRCKADIFSNINWGDANVLNQTLAAARQQGLSIAQLETLNDIDTETDLTAWQPGHDWQRPYLSVVMPALNEAEQIETAIAGARSPDSEIIVVDGGSQDRTAALARNAAANVISTPRGRALQQNRGACEARGEVLLFLHADTRLPKNYTAHVFETLMDPKVAAGAFGFKTDYNSWSMRLIEKCARIRSQLLHMPYGDQALFMPKTVFDNVGGFPLVPIAEDLFLVKRLTRMGRIGHARANAITSGRRWRTIGVWRATLVNYLIAGGCMAGVPPKHLAPLYRWWIKP